VALDQVPIDGPYLAAHMAIAGLVEALRARMRERPAVAARRR
jgi:hypothetical protein